MGGRGPRQRHRHPLDLIIKEITCLNKSMNKSQAAFTWTCENMMSVTGTLYMWTFTFEKVYPAWHYSRLWNRFVQDWRDIVPLGCEGVRVVQMHKRHGFHYHALVSHFIPAARMWKIARKHGMEMIDVFDTRKGRRGSKRVYTPEEAIAYCSRYLSDETRDQNKFPIRLRRWGGLFGTQVVTCGDIVYNSPHSDCLRYAAGLWGRGADVHMALCRFRGSPYRFGDYRSLMCIVDYKQFGRFDSFHWPESEFDRIMDERLSPWFDWVKSEDETIWEPGFLPRILPDENNPF